MVRCPNVSLLLGLHHPMAVASRECARTEIYRPNSRSISQLSNPAGASGRAEVRVGAGLAAPLAACAAAVGAEGALTCEAVCIRLENTPPACEFGSAATGTP